MRFQFQSDPGQFSYKPALFTDAIKILVSVNFGIFLLQTMARTEGLFFPLFGLVPKMVWSEFMLWQPFTYLFFHGGVWHVLINMFVLWMFGSELERLWGKERFLKFYFVTGVGAGLVTMLFGLNSMTPIVGASGAVYGIIPIKSLWFVIGIGTIAFMSSFDNVSQISHLTHLSGMVIGYLMLKRPVRLYDLWFSIRKRTLEYKIQQEEKKTSHQQEIERNIDSILDKINREGFDSLTEEEHDRLYKGSQSLSRTKKKD